MKRTNGTSWVRKWFGSQQAKGKKDSKPQTRATLALETLEVRLAPATRVWDGGSTTSNNWSDAVNWQGNVRPAAGDILVFPNGASRLVNNNDFAAGTRFASISIAGSGYTLAGNSISLGEGTTTQVNTGFIIANLGATDNNINFGISMVGAQGSRPFFSVGTLGARLTVNGTLLGGTGIDLSKDGQGTLILTANNSTFVGAITITEGSLNVRNSMALGSTAAGTTVLSTFQRSGQLQVENVTGSIAEPIRLNGAGPTNDGALLNVAGSTNLTGLITLDSDATIGANAGFLTLQGVITDTGSGHTLTKEGPAQVILDPLRTASGNTYRGQTFVNAGILAIRHSLALGNAGNTVRGVNDTVVNSFPDRSGTLQLDFVANPLRIDPFASTSRVGTQDVIVGFTVPRELLTLNGPGADGIHTLPKTLGFPGTTVIGALFNFRGTNTWQSDIRLWTGDSTVTNFDSLYWNWGTVGMGAADGTAMVIAGNIDDDILTRSTNDPFQTDIPYSLIKTGLGRVIFQRDNTYRGRTEILLGFLNIRDSRALGRSGAEPNGTIVFPGGTLELEADTIPDSNPAGPSPDGKPHLDTDLVIDTERLFLMGTGGGGPGATGAGALRNLRGVNEVKGIIPLGTRIVRGNLVTNTGVVFLDRGAWIGVEPDAAPFNKFDLSQLTLDGVVQDGNQYAFNKVIDRRLIVANTPGGVPVPGDLFKTGGGELVLTQNNTYTGVTYIRQGWVTARANNALGANDPAFGQSDMPETHVANGASLHLKRTRAGQDIAVAENVWLAGDGISHRFAEMNNKGALLNLSGDTTLSGDVKLIGVPDVTQAGIGVAVDPTESGVGLISELTLTGQVSETPLAFPIQRVSYTGTAQFPGSRTNPNPRDASIAEDRFLVDTGAVQGTLVINYNFVNQNELRIFYQGVQIGTTGPATGAGTLTVNYGPGTDTNVEFVMNLGSTGNPAAQWHYVATVQPTKRLSGLEKLGANRLVLQGPGTYGGAVTVTEGVLRVQADTALGVALPTNPSSTATPNPGTTTVLTGAALELAGYVPGVAGGRDGGVAVDERIVFNGVGVAEVQRITLTGTAGTFRLTFNGQTTASLPRTATAAQVQAALNGLSTIGANGVTVTGVVDPSSGARRFTIKFSKDVGVNQNSITAVGSGGTTATVTTLVDGLVQVLTNLSDDNMLNGPISLNSPAIPLDVKPDSRLAMYGSIGGSGGLTKNGTGKLVLGGNNTYTGNTRVNAGTVNVQSPTALGAPGATATTGGTTVAVNAQIEVQGDITIAGEALVALGDGPNAAPNVPLSWHSLGGGAAQNGQTNGRENVTGRITSVATDPRNPNVIYASTASGGAWRTKNGGVSWEPLIDAVTAANYADQILFTGAIAVGPTQPNFIYVGLGNPMNSVESYYGKGVLRSSDYGKTWQLIQAPNRAFDRDTISKIVVDPSDARVFYVAVQGNGANGAPGGGWGIWRFNGITNVWTNLTRDDLPAPARPFDDTLDRFSDLVVVNANPTASAPNYPNLSGAPGYYSAPQQRLIAFALGDHRGSEFNGIYYAFLEDFNDTIPGDEIISAGFDSGWSLGNDVPGIEPGLGPFYGEIKLTATRPFEEPASGRVDEVITIYAAISYPVNTPRELNEQDGELRRVRELNVTYNPANGEWDTGVFAPDIAVANYYGGTDTPNFPPINVQGNETGSGWYSPTLAASPFDASVLFLGGLGEPFARGPFLSSPNGGAPDFAPATANIGTKNPAPHVNYHASTFDSLGRLVVGTDGGIWRYNGTAAAGTWENLNGNFLSITEYNGLDVHPFEPFKAVGGALSNGVQVYDGQSWRLTNNGHGGQIRIDPKNPNVIYASVDNTLRRSTNGGLTWTTIQTVAPSVVFPPNVVGTGLPYQFNEPHPFPYLLHAGRYPTYKSSSNFPYALDPANPSRLLVVQRSIVPSDNNIDVLQVTLAAEQAAANNTIPTYVTIGDSDDFEGGRIVSIGLANLQGGALDGGPEPTDTIDFPDAQQNGANAYDPNTIYVFTTNGLFVTKNGGQLWVQRDDGLVGAATEYSNVVVDPRNRSVAYATRHLFDGRQVFRTTDAGRTWIDISGDLPDLPVWELTVNTRNGDLYIGSDNGVYRLRGVNNAGDNFAWERFGEGLPNVQVKNLVFNPTTYTLTAGTFGRGVYQVALDESTDDFSNNVVNQGAVRAVSGSAVWIGNITLTGNTDFRAGVGAQINYIGNISDGGRNFLVNKVGQGRVIFSGTNTLGGLIDVKEGVLTVRNPQALGTAVSPPVTDRTVVRTGAALEMQSNLIRERVELNGNGPQFNGVNTGALRNVSNNNTFTGVLTLVTNSTIGVDSGSQLTIGVRTGLAGTGVITDGAGNAGFTKELTGALFLNTVNTFDGAVTVNQGTLLLANARALGAATGGVTVRDGSQLRLAIDLTIVGETLTLSGSGIFNGGALVVAGAGASVWRGPVVLPTVAWVNVLNGSAALTVDGPVSGAGGVRKIGPGRLILAQNNTFAGGVSIVEGAIRVQTAGGLGTTAGGTEVLAGAALELVNTAGMSILDEALTLVGTGLSGTGALRNLTGNNVWTGTVRLGGDAAVDVNTATQLVLGGVISDAGLPAAAPDLTKRGAGRLVLAGTNTYRGKTIVTLGNLQVNGTTGAVDLAGGALSGTGTVGAVATVAGKTGIVAPGLNTSPATEPGLLTVNGPVTWNATTTYFVNLNGTTPGTGHDKLMVTGNVNLGNARLGGTSVATLAVGDTMTIVEATGTITGRFNGLANNAFVFFSGRRFRINYTTTTVTLTRV